MIVCPKCKEEIEDNSHYCDQCGQELVYCSSCERVGMGRRCTHCGGLMVSVDELMEQRRNPRPSTSAPILTLFNPSLDIRIVGVNGAVIGRRQGPYRQVFEGNRYVSGVHAQLLYKPDTGWNIIDKHSSNGTKLNQHDLLPDVPMPLKSGDIVTLANVSLQVSIA